MTEQPDPEPVPDPGDFTDADGLDARDRAIIASLAVGRPYAQAAEAAGVSESTVGRRMQDPVFRAAVEKERTRRTVILADSLSALQPQAILVLNRLMREGSDALQLRAATTVLDQGIRYREQAFVVERLAAVEDQLARRPRR